MDAAGIEIVNYKLQGVVKSHSVSTIMDVNQNEVPIEELIMLIIFGFFSFKSVAMENKATDLLIMTASA